MDIDDFYLMVKTGTNSMVFQRKPFGVRGVKFEMPIALQSSNMCKWEVHGEGLCFVCVCVCVCIHENSQHIDVI